MPNPDDLARSRCTSSDCAVVTLSDSQIATLLARLEGWTRADGTISRTFAFPDYGQTMAFVNATAWISHREDHHPELAVGYNTCRVTYSTHTVRGLTKNDFICAAKLDVLYEF